MNCALTLQCILCCVRALPQTASAPLASCFFPFNLRALALAVPSARNALPPRYPHSHSLASYRSLLKCHLIRKTFPDHLLKSHLHLSLHHLLPYPAESSFLELIITRYGQYLHASWFLCLSFCSHCLKILWGQGPRLSWSLLCPQFLDWCRAHNRRINN